MNFRVWEGGWVGDEEERFVRRGAVGWILAESGAVRVIWAEREVLDRFWVRMGLNGIKTLLYVLFPLY